MKDGFISDTYDWVALKIAAQDITFECSTRGWFGSIETDKTGGQITAGTIGGIEVSLTSALPPDEGSQISRR